MSNKGRTFLRSDLYELVWTRPIKTLASEFEVSDVGLAKACKKAGIPLPSRGYWAKKAAGKPVIKVALAPRFPGAPDEVHVGFGGRYYNWGYSLAEALHTPIPPEPIFEESMESVEDRAKKMVGRVTCPSNFEQTEPQIAQLLSHDIERREAHARFPTSYNEPKYDRGPERRRLLILNALFLALRRAGCRPSISTSKWLVTDADRRAISVDVGGTWVRFTLELTGQRRSCRNGQKNSERMRLDLGTAHNATELAWEDNDERRIERCLTDIAVAVIVKGEGSYRHHRVGMREHLIKQKAEAERLVLEEKKERERRAREAREKEEQRRIDELLAQAAKLSDAEAIRAYISKTTARALEVGVDAAHLAAWASWANAEADRIDPVLNGVVRNAVEFWRARIDHDNLAPN